MIHHIRANHPAGAAAALTKLELLDEIPRIASYLMSYLTTQMGQAGKMTRYSPAVVWMKEHVDNPKWLIQYFYAMCDRYEQEKGKKHFLVNTRICGYFQDDVFEPVPLRLKLDLSTKV